MSRRSDENVCDNTRILFIAVCTLGFSVVTEAIASQVSEMPHLAGAFVGAVMGFVCGVICDPKEIRNNCSSLGSYIFRCGERAPEDAELLSTPAA